MRQIWVICENSKSYALKPQQSVVMSLQYANTLS
uniref:Uncharacterized protein n=1 Tax=Arundo donax TaxID=35708 RepID=A0A0A8YG10_ARUDO